MSILAMHMLTMCGAMISALSLSSLQLMPSSPVAFVADILRNWIRFNLKDPFSGLLCELKFRNFK